MWEKECALDLPRNLAILYINVSTWKNYHKVYCLWEMI
ncbi:hypothetical protein GJA_1475 [Janthinobacterium agaricidamnosum NBRC 102515 = DSM 9628]|uniref:Uncharacterized protein n=1 Tax=Janthinobacterium agaricidamnosum NBRC 102515 = DSM 9628 TaxID=1349767 RepID=W0V2L9_9BURK|nr:hypothetical protein GJA_1475 [Janthinobacterium agaricidamnosum NBRC 102515 = DSM 9628]